MKLGGKTMSPMSESFARNFGFIKEEKRSDIPMDNSSAKIDPVTGQIIHTDEDISSSFAQELGLIIKE